MDLEKLNPSCIAGGNIKYYSLKMLYPEKQKFQIKLNTQFPFSSVITLLGLYFRKKLNSSSHKNMYMNVFDNFIHKSQKFIKT